MGIDKTLEERGSKYGEFKEHALITQLLKAVMQGNTTQLLDLINNKDNIQRINSLWDKW